MSPSVQAIRRFLEAHDRFAAHNGITVEDADYDYGKVSLAFEDHAKNSLDMLHGGALFTLADMAFGLASNFGQEDGTMISTNATISYMKSAKTGPIVAEARLANGGRHLATYEVKIYDGQGTYIACAMISGYRLDTKLAIEEYRMWGKGVGTFLEKRGAPPRFPLPSPISPSSLSQGFRLAGRPRGRSPFRQCAENTFPRLINLRAAEPLKKDDS